MIPEKEIIKTTEILENNGVIAFPTDTVWGIGCLVESRQAVDRIYQLKIREKNKPLILLGSRLEYLLPYIESLPVKAEELIKKFFPGALTIVLKKSSKTPDCITSGFDTVGIRIPDHPILLELLEKAVPGHALATTSANISGQGSVSTKEDVFRSLGDNIDYIIDDYWFSVCGKESTVVMVDADNKIKLLRQGIIDLGVEK
ncbi:MAG TPA: L-threonylcarbamoyladenylate synthase [Candidatus Gastranaerophilales bacterium]|nr:L-threonylcarbamoyladenylate synthase [Candidatus Gastranaerophilales bacterium]